MAKTFSPHEKLIWDFWIGKGFTPEAAAGVMGNLRQEAGVGIPTDSVNPKSGASGMCQWLGARKTGLFNFAKQQGKSWKDASVQLEWAWKELNGADSTTKSKLDARGGLEKLKSSRDIGWVVETFEQAFERAGKHERVYPRRKQFARDYYEAFKGSSSGGGSFEGGDIGGGYGSNDEMLSLGKQFEYNSPSMILGKAPDVEEDEYPEHRYARSPFALRIGDAQFFIPPLNISTSKVTNIEGKHVVRAKTATVTKSGFTTNRLDIRLVFADIDQINGWKVAGPAGKVYYMDGLRALLAQFIKNPFMPIRNEYINDRLGIFNVALYNINLTTDPEIPNMVICDLSLLECTMEPYFALPDFMYDQMINYPLWRWFYQQMLMDDDRMRYGNTYLRPLKKHMTGETMFRVLDTYYIDQMKNDVVAKAKEDAEKGDNEFGYVNPEYALYRFKMADIRQLMSDWEIPDLICTNVQVGIGKVMAPIYMDDYEMPMFQDMGGVTKNFVMEFYCTSREQLEGLQAMVSHSEQMARDYRHRFVGGFIEIHNEIVNLAGIEFAMVVNMETTTVDDIDDNYIVRIAFQEFNHLQKNQERLNGVNATLTEYASDMGKNFEDVFELSDKRNRKPEIIMEHFVEKAIGQLELYPDLDLPTYEIADKVVKQINEHRSKRGQSKMPFDKLPRASGDYYVEPDFYMIYPTLSDAYQAINTGDFGAKILNILIDGTYEDIANETDGIQWNEIWDSISPNFQDNSFNSFEQQNKYLNAVNLDISYDKTQEDYITDGFNDWSSAAGNDIPDVSELVEMMLHDMVRFDCRYRLVRAFPTYMMMFIDEGQWVDGRRLWNSYYTYHAIHEITVTKDKDNPVDLAYIKLSNTYGTFNFVSKMRDPRDFSNSTPRTPWERFKDLWKTWNLSAEDVMAEAKELMDHAQLKEGARVHIRLGYSSNAKNLPICFNGHIASVNDGPDIDIVCQGDGVELIASPVETHPNAGTPNEPHNAFQKYLTARKSNYWFSASNMNFFNNYESLYGIEHFGFVESQMPDYEKFNDKGESTKPTDIWDTGVWESMRQHVQGFFDGIIIDNVNWIASKITGHPNFEVYDIMKNIYRGSFQPHTGVNVYKRDETAEMFDSFSGFVSGLRSEMERFNVFDGEKNVNFSAYNKTVWDLGQNYSAFVPEFICGVHDHGFRSTLFFGMPHWPVKYGYVKKSGKSGLKGSHYDEKYKPYQQMHYFNTGSEIIQNNIKASSEHIRHVATGIYMRGDTSTIVEGITVYADRSILAHAQKAMIVDTNVFQDIFGHDATYEFVASYIIKPLLTGIAGTIDLVAGGIETILDKFDFPGSWDDKLEEDLEKFLEWGLTDRVEDWTEAMARPGYVAAESVTIGSLQRNFMQMYQGELILLGYPAVKPWDLFYLNDSRLQMSGTAQVGRVTHSLSRSSGFTTVIKPDLIVGRTDGRGGRNFMIQAATSIATVVSIYAGRKIMGCKAMKWIGKRSVTTSWNGAMKFSKKVAYKINGRKGVRVVRSFYMNPKDSNDVSLPKKWTKGVLKFVRGNFFFSVLVGGIAEKFMRWYDKETKYNNVIYIYPLWKGGQPFTAGIPGAMHIIPNYIDPRYADPLGSGSAGFNSEGGGSSGGGDGGDAPETNGQFRHPLAQKTNINSPFGWRFGGTDYHNGIDLRMVDWPSNRIKTKVYCVADGVVRSKWPMTSNGGNMVGVEHKVNGEIYQSWYLHLERFGSKVKEGAHLKKGDEIGIMGTTGASAIHLHFEIVKGPVRAAGTPPHGKITTIDPIPFMKKQGVEF